MDIALKSFDPKNKNKLESINDSSNRYCILNKTFPLYNFSCYFKIPRGDYRTKTE